MARSQRQEARGGDKKRGQTEGGVEWRERGGQRWGDKKRDLDAHAIAKVVAEEVDVDAFEKVELLVYGAPLDVDAAVLRLLCIVDVRACVREWRTYDMRMRLMDAEHMRHLRVYPSAGNNRHL